MDVVEHAISSILETLGVGTVSEEELDELRETLANLMEISYTQGYDSGLLGIDERTQ